MSTAAMLQRIAPALDSNSLRPEDVLQFKAPVAGFLCPVEANTFGLEFLNFEIRDYDSGRTVYSVSNCRHDPIHLRAPAVFFLSHALFCPMRPRPCMRQCMLPGLEGCSPDLILRDKTFSHLRPTHE